MDDRGTSYETQRRPWMALCVVVLTVVITQVRVNCEITSSVIAAEKEWRTLTSEDYPFRYRSNTFDAFLLRAKHSDDVIDIIMEAMKLESQPSNCPSDYLEFYDGSYTNGSLLKRACTLDKACFSGTNGTMLIIFRSDSSREGKGFKISYRSSERNDACSSGSLPFRWIGQLIGVAIAIIVLCAFWEFFKKKHGRRERLSGRCLKLSACCSNYASDRLHTCRNKCSCFSRLVHSLVSRFRRNGQEPSRVTPEISTLPSNGQGTLPAGTLPDRNAIYGVGSFENEAFDDSDFSVTPPPYPREFAAEPPPYEMCVSNEHPHLDEQPPSYSVSQSQISESGTDVTTQISFISPPPSYDHVILNPNNYRCNS
ncbi:uncharacterized protein LOC121377637 [Gigantopelta aegis]|uniref:uncharacterized protein LOC121377637 n=1 Tax=Gigantopelta aegis TaxID=1735272 RepID=UPI001B889457|nr:uncharacterized protein LOC121377637 [Gigantopelta aegis]